MERLNSGELKIIFRNISRIVLIGLTTGGRKAWQEEETRKDIKTVLIRQDKKSLDLRALQRHSGRNLIDPSFQDNAVIQERTSSSTYLSHWMCNQSYIPSSNSGLIPGSQNSSKRQTVFFLPIDPRYRSHKDPEKIDSECTTSVDNTCMNAWKNHQDAVYWVDINHATSERIHILSDSIECNHRTKNTSRLLNSTS